VERLGVWLIVAAWGMAEPLLDEAITTIPAICPRGSDAVLACRGAVVLEDRQLRRQCHRRHRRATGSCWRKLPAARQAMLVLVRVPITSSTSCDQLIFVVIPST
jgi:hypothetical protein